MGKKRIYKLKITNIVACQLLRWQINTHITLFREVIFALVFHAADIQMHFLAKAFGITSHFSGTLININNAIGLFEFHTHRGLMAESISSIKSTHNIDICKLILMRLETE